MNDLQHGVGASAYVAPEFEAKDLGAPFRVLLHNAVKVTKDVNTGLITSYAIPDLEGLLAEVVFSRVLHERKMSGAEIKFVRRAISMKQKDLAEKLDMSAEHLSRCETGTLVMSPSNEKLLRIIALRAALKLHKMKSGDDKTRIEEALDKLFDGFKPVAVFGSGQELVFDFHRARIGTDGNGRFTPDEGKWKEKEAA